MRPTRASANAVHRRLVSAYGHAVWRKPLLPLDELVSTILSQNTNDVNRDRAFEALRSRFPAWEDVRDAAEAEVVDAIRSDGLANQKGPRIQAVLREITAERGDLNLEFLRDMPSDGVRRWLQKLKGVGPKTAGIDSGTRGSYAGGVWVRRYADQQRRFRAVAEAGSVGFGWGPGGTDVR